MLADSRLFDVQGTPIMKRFHVHVGVADLACTIRFYSALFGAERPPAISRLMPIQ